MTDPAPQRDPLDPQPPPDDAPPPVRERRPLHDWLQLLRAPNLLTVPGDALAGFFLASLATVAPAHAGLRAAMAAMAGVCLYAMGLIENDLTDLPADAEQRPNRPLPAGRISPHHAMGAMMALAIAALALAALAGRATLWTAAVTIILISLYNRFSKRVAVLGPVNMGLCRAGNLMLGAAAMGWAGVLTAPVLVSAAALAAYVAAITFLARRETQRRDVGVEPWLPPAAMVLWGVALGVALGPTGGVLLTGASVAGAIGLIAVAMAVRVAMILAGAPHPRLVQAAIGWLISGLLFVQAAQCALTGWAGVVAAGVLVVAWPVQQLLARRFYAS